MVMKKVEVRWKKGDVGYFCAAELLLKSDQKYFDEALCFKS